MLEICYFTKRAGGTIVQVPVSGEGWRPSKFNLLHEAVYKLHPVGLVFRVRRVPA